MKEEKQYNHIIIIIFYFKKVRKGATGRHLTCVGSERTIEGRVIISLETCNCCRPVHSVEDKAASDHWVPEKPRKQEWGFSEGVS